MSAVISAAVVGAVSVGYSAYQGYEARKDQRAANRRAEKIEAVRGQRERAQAIRQNRMAAASVFAAGANAGVAGSSGVQGTLGALGTNQAINFQFANSIDQLNAERLKYLGKADVHEGNADIGRAVGKMASYVGG